MSQLLYSPSFCFPNKEPTKASLATQQSYRSRKTILNGWSPHLTNHLSCQNRTWLPSPTSKRIYCRNPSHLRLIPFLKPQLWVPRTLFVHQPPHSIFHSYYTPPQPYFLNLKVPLPFTQQSLVKCHQLLNSQSTISNWSARYISPHQRMFHLITHSTPKKVSLQFLNPVHYSNRNSKQGEIISR